MKTAAMQSDATSREGRSGFPPAASDLTARPEQIEAFRQLSERRDDDDRHGRHETDEDATSSQDALSLVDFTLDAAPASETPPPAPASTAAFQAAMNARESFAEVRRYEGAAEHGDRKDRDSSEAVSASDNNAAPDVMVFAHYVQHDPHTQADAAATARSVRVERHAAVTELVQALESCAATLLTPEGGARHDRVDMMLSLPHMEGATVALFLENGRLVVEFAASGMAAKWLGGHARGMSEELSARLRRPVLTRIQADGEEAPEAEAASARMNDAVVDVRRVVTATRAAS